MKPSQTHHRLIEGYLSIDSNKRHGESEREYNASKKQKIISATCKTRLRLVALYANYWRDKRGHEIDFVLPEKKNKPVAIECKWRASDFDPSGFKAFRRHYTSSKNFLVSQDIDRSYSEIIVA